MNKVTREILILVHPSNLIMKALLLIIDYKRTDYFFWLDNTFPRIFVVDICDTNWFLAEMKKLICYHKDAENAFQFYVKVHESEE